jgi:anti-sigma B factor antagonist
MELSTSIAGGCLVIEVLASELDISVSEAFKDAVLERYGTATVRDLLLDLDRVTFMDSKAIGVMVSIRKAVVARGGRLGLCNLHPHVRKIIQVVTLGTLFDAFPDRETALAQYC